MTDLLSIFVYVRMMSAHFLAHITITYYNLFVLNIYLLINCVNIKYWGAVHIMYVCNCLFWRLSIVSYSNSAYNVLLFLLISDGCHCKLLRVPVLIYDHRQLVQVQYKGCFFKLELQWYLVRDNIICVIAIFSFPFN